MNITAITRELINSPVRQSVREARARRVRLPDFDTTPTAAACRAYDDSAPSTELTGVLSGSPTVTDGEFVTNMLDPDNAHAGRVYRIEIQFAVGSETIIRYFRVILEA